jgi:hypothetical protein
MEYARRVGFVDDGKSDAVKKRDLPTKICLVCQRPFAWRRKWARSWDEVKYCSDTCRMRKKSNKA